MTERELPGSLMTSDQATQAWELMTREEELIPELQPYLADGPIGKMLHHPLIVEMLIDPKRAALHNERYRQKVKETKSARVTGDWHKFIALHERPYRFDALEAALREGLADHNGLYELVAWVWYDSENIWQHYTAWRDVWENLTHPHLTMDEDDLKSFENLSSRIQVYRGWKREFGWEGLSWTLDRNKAKWFAKRFVREGEEARVTEGTVLKSKVLAHFVGRQEQEILVLPENVWNRRVRSVRG